MNGGTSLFRRAARTPSLLAGAVILAVLIVLAILAGWFFPEDPMAMVGPTTLWPFQQAAFPLGTDQLGRDLAAQLSHGARVSLAVSLCSAALAIAVGVFQGGIQAMSRSYYSKIIPKDHANEYFGFYDIFGKTASILGTFLVATTTSITGNASLGVLSIAILLVLALIFLLLQKDPTQA